MVLDKIRNWLGSLEGKLVKITPLVPVEHNERHLCREQIVVLLNLFVENVELADTYADIILKEVGDIWVQKKMKHASSRENRQKWGGLGDIIRGMDHGGGIR